MGRNVAGIAPKTVSFSFLWTLLQFLELGCEKIEDLSFGSGSFHLQRAWVLRNLVQALQIHTYRCACTF